MAVPALFREIFTRGKLLYAVDIYKQNKNEHLTPASKKTMCLSSRIYIEITSELKCLIL